MSIIREALKKADRDEKVAQKTSPVTADTRNVRRWTTRSLVAMALLVGSVSLVIIGSRLTGMFPERGTASKGNTRAGASLPDPVKTNAPGEMGEVGGGSSDQNLTALTRQAERYFWLGEFAQAEELFRQALKTGSGPRAELFNNLGLCISKQGRLKEAVLLYDQALAIDKGMVEALNNRAVAFRGLNRLDEALDDLQSILEKEPDWSYAQFNLGTLHEAMGRVDKALNFYRQYLSNTARPPGLDETQVRQRIKALELQKQSFKLPALSKGMER